MNADISSKEQLSAFSVSYASEIDQIKSELSSIKSELSNVEDYDGIPISSAAQKIMKDIESLSSYMDSSVSNLKTYVDTLKETDVDDSPKTDKDAEKDKDKGKDKGNGGPKGGGGPIPVTTPVADPEKEKENENEPVKEAEKENPSEVTGTPVSNVVVEHKEINNDSQTENVVEEFEEDELEDDLSDEDYIDDEFFDFNNQNSASSDDNISSSVETDVTDEGYTVSSKKGNGFGKALGIVGAVGAAGAVAYAGTKVVKKIQDKDDLDE